MGSFLSTLHLTSSSPSRYHSSLHCGQTLTSGLWVLFITGPVKTGSCWREWLPLSPMKTQNWVVLIQPQSLWLHGFELHFSQSWFQRWENIIPSNTVEYRGTHIPGAPKINYPLWNYTSNSFRKRSCCNSKDSLTEYLTTLASLLYISQKHELPFYWLSAWSFESSYSYNLTLLRMTIYGQQNPAQNENVPSL